MKLTLDSISKTLGGKDIFTDFSLELQNGMKLCICGANGIGKSVLIKIMAGKESVDKGNVLYGKNVRIGYSEQELSLASLSCSLLEYVQSALPNWDNFWNEWNKASESSNEKKLAELTEIQSQWEQVYGYNPEHYCTEVLYGIGFSQNDLHKPLQSLSGGFRERAKLARVLVEGVDILLLDEPINHLDIEAIEWLEQFLLAFEGIVVFIAHDRVFMDTVSTHTLYLGGSKPFFRKGTYSAITEQLEEIEKQKRVQAKQLEQKIEDKMLFIEKFKAKPSKARQAASHKKMVKRLEKELEGVAPEKKQKAISFRFPTPEKAERTLLVAENITKGFQTTLWQNLNFSIYNDSVIALLGSNGVGKSTLLKTLLGSIEADTGTITRNPSLRFGYFSQHQSDILCENATVLEEIRRLSHYKSTEEEYMSVLGLFHLGQRYFEQPITSLSGGEKNRLILASIFLSKANCLLLDEPTNHLDLETRQALSLALSEFQGAIILIAHDRYILQQIAKEYWYVTHHGIHIYNSYADYIAAKKNEEENTQKKAFPQQEETTPLEKKHTISKEERKKKKQEEATKRAEYYTQSSPLKKEYAQREHDLDAIYTRIAEIQLTLSLTELYNNPDDVRELAKELHLLQEQSNVIVEELVLLEEKLAVLTNQYQME